MYIIVFQLQEFIESKMLPQFEDVVNVATDLRNSISKEARQFGSVSLFSLDRRVVDGWEFNYWEQNFFFYFISEFIWFLKGESIEKFLTETFCRLEKHNLSFFDESNLCTRLFLLPFCKRIQRVPASSLSIHRLESPNFTSLCQNLSFPVHKVRTGMYCCAACLYKGGNLFIYFIWGFIASI